MSKLFSYIFMGLTFLNCFYLNAKEDVFFVPKTLLKSYRAQHIIQDITELTSKERKEFLKVTFIEKNAKGCKVKKTEFISLKYYERMKENSVSLKDSSMVKIVVTNSDACQDPKQVQSKSNWNPLTHLIAITPWWR